MKIFKTALVALALAVCGAGLALAERQVSVGVDTIGTLYGQYTVAVAIPVDPAVDVIVEPFFEGEDFSVLWDGGGEWEAGVRLGAHYYPFGDLVYFGAYLSPGAHVVGENVSFMLGGGARVGARAVIGDGVFLSPSIGVEHSAVVDFAGGNVSAEFRRGGFSIPFRLLVGVEL